MKKLLLLNLSLLIISAPLAGKSFEGFLTENNKKIIMSPPLITTLRVATAASTSVMCGLFSWQALRPQGSLPLALLGATGGSVIQALIQLGYLSNNKNYKLLGTLEAIGSIGTLIGAAYLAKNAPPSIAVWLAINTLACGLSAYHNLTS